MLSTIGVIKMSIDFDKLVNQLENMTGQWRKTKRPKDNEVLMCCFGHDDTNPSLSVTYDKNTGKVLYHCFADCDIEDLKNAYHDYYGRQLPRSDGYTSQNNKSGYNSYQPATPTHKPLSKGYDPSLLPFNIDTGCEDPENLPEIDNNNLNSPNVKKTEYIYVPNALKKIRYEQPGHSKTFRWFHGVERPYAESFTEWTPGQGGNQHYYSSRKDVRHQNLWFCEGEKDVDTLNRYFTNEGSDKHYNVALCMMSDSKPRNKTIELMKQPGVTVNLILDADLPGLKKGQNLADLFHEAKKQTDWTMELRIWLPKEKQETRATIKPKGGQDISDVLLQNNLTEVIQEVTLEDIENAVTYMKEGWNPTAETEAETEAELLENSLETIDQLKKQGKLKDFFYHVKAEMFYRHNGKFWEPDRTKGDLEIREYLSETFRNCSYPPVGDKGPKPFKATRAEQDELINHAKMKLKIKNVQPNSPFDDPTIRVLPIENAFIHFGDEEATVHDLDPLDVFNVYQVPVKKGDLGQPIDGTRFEKFLNESIRNEHDRMLMQQWCGYVLSGRVNQQRFMILHGQPNAGKSTWAYLLSTLLSANGVATPTFKGLQGAHGMMDRYDKKLWIMEEIDGDSTEMKAKTAVLKQWTGGCKVEVNIKFKGQFAADLQARIMMIANSVPDFKDPSLALMRRVLAIKFDNPVSEQETDTNLQDKLNCELPVILQWALDGYKSLQNHGWNKQGTMTESLKLIEGNLDPFRAFMTNHYDVTGNDINKVSCEEFRKLYVAYMNSEFHTSTTLSKQKVNKKLTEQYNVGRVRKNDVWHYVGLKRKDATIGGDHDYNDNIPKF